MPEPKHIRLAINGYGDTALAQDEKELADVAGPLCLRRLPSTPTR